jgi:uncharacterized CHY-type Zn-finger protein
VDSSKTQADQKATEYSGDELASIFRLSRTLAYRRKLTASRLGVDLTKTQDVEADKQRLQHAFLPRYSAQPKENTYVCRECRQPATMNLGRQKAVCRDCVPDAYARNRYSKFGITEPQYKELFNSQAGLCGICEKPLTHRKIKGSRTFSCIDHDHVTMKVRGLLCAACNIKLSGVKSAVARKSHSLD